MPSEKSQFRGTRWARFKNLSGEVIPAFGVVRIVGVDSEGVISVELVGPLNTSICLTNGPTEVANTQFGQLAISYPAYIKLKSGAVSPIVGDFVVPITGETGVIVDNNNTTSRSVWTVVGDIVADQYCMVGYPFCQVKCV